MFTPSMKALIKHVMGMGSLQQQQRPEALTGPRKGGKAPSSLVAAFTPVVVDTSRLARQVCPSVCRWEIPISWSMRVSRKSDNL